MTFKQELAALKWYMAEKGQQRLFTVLEAFSNAAFGSAITGGPATFGDLVLSDPTMVSQTPTGLTGLVPGNVTIPDPGQYRQSEKEPHNGFRI